MSMPTTWEMNYKGFLMMGNLQGQLAYQSFTIPYTLYGKVENFLQSNDYIIEDIEYLEDVEILLYVNNDEYDSFYRQIMDLTSGLAQMEILEEKFIPLINGVRFGQ